MRLELAEEGVGMRGAHGGAAGSKAVDENAQPLLLFGKVALVGNHKALGGGGILAKWFVVANHFRLDDATDDVANQHPWRLAVSHSRLQTAHAVRHPLPGVHLSPLSPPARFSLSHP